MSFDWQTEEHNWDETPPRRAANRWTIDLPTAELPPAPELVETPPPARPRQRLRYLLAVGGLVAALLLVLYWQLDRRSAAAQAGITAEVTATQATIVEAAQRTDGELFVSFLSGRDPDWAKSQEQLVRAGGFLDRSAFALRWTPTAPVSPTITLAPDLRAAELTWPQAYVIDVGNGLTETVQLQQTAVFRQGPDRWLYAPPDDAFWGEDAATGSRYVHVRYPARDADVVEPLARDLDAALAELCRAAGDACAGNVFIDLTLSTDPAALAVYRLPQDIWAGGEAVVLPTPTLFGRPSDDASYRALSRAYTARVVAAAAANLAGWQCCRDRLFYGALLDALLHRLGLAAWPVGAADYGQLARRPEQLRAVESLWRADTATAEERRAVYTLVDFLVARGDSSIVDMQWRLARHEDESYWQWLSHVTGGAYGTQEDFESDLLRYAAERGTEVAFD